MTALSSTLPTGITDSGLLVRQVLVPQAPGEKLVVITVAVVFSLLIKLYLHPYTHVYMHIHIYDRSMKVG